MRREAVHTYPVSVQAGFDYLSSFRAWPSWFSGVVEILEPDKCAWKKPGDKVRFAYKLLGRRVEVTAILEEMREGEFVKFRTESPGLPGDTWQYTFVPKGQDALEIRAVVDTEEPDNLLGRLLGRYVMPWVLGHDLHVSMDNLTSALAKVH